METIKIELEDGTIVEVSKDFLDAPEDEQAKFIDAVLAMKNNDRTPGEKAQQQQHTTRNPIAGFMGSAFRAAGNVAETVDAFEDTVQTAVRPNFYRAALSPEQREYYRQAAELMRSDPNMTIRGVRERLGADPAKHYADQVAELPGVGSTAAGALNGISASFGSYAPGIGGKEIIDAAKGGRPLQALRGAAELAIGGGIAGAPEGAMFLHPATARIQMASAVGGSARARAANDGGREADALDVAAVLPAEVANAIMARGALTKAKGAGAVVGAEAGTGVLQGALSDSAQTIGTETGFDVERSAARGLEGGLEGLGGGLGLAASSHLQQSETRRMERRYLGDLNDPKRQRKLAIQKKVVDDIDGLLASERQAGGNPSMAHNGTHAARTLAEKAYKDYSGVIEGLQESGKVPKGFMRDTDGDLISLRTHFELLGDGGRNAKNSQRLMLTEQKEAIDRIKDIGPVARQALKDKLTYIEELSHAGIKARQVSGPIANTLETTGNLLGHALGFELGSGMGKTGSFGAALATSNVLGVGARQLGAVGDRILGNSTPDLVRRRDMIEGAMEARNIPEANINLLKTFGPLFAEKPKAGIPLSSLTPEQAQALMPRLSRTAQDKIAEEVQATPDAEVTLSAGELARVKAMTRGTDPGKIMGSPRMKTVQEYNPHLSAQQAYNALDNLHATKVISDGVYDRMIEFSDDKLDSDLYFAMEQLIDSRADDLARGLTELSTESQLYADEVARHEQRLIEQEELRLP